MSDAQIKYIKSLKDGKRRLIREIAKSQILHRYKEELETIVEEIEKKVGLKKND